MQVEKGKFHDIGIKANKNENYKTMKNQEFKLIAVKLAEVKKEWKQVEGPKR